MAVPRFLSTPSEFARFDLTDQGLIPIGKNFSNLEVLVLEITSKNILNPTEFEVIQKYWLKWFNEMGIKKSRLLKTQDTPAQVKQVVEGFVLSPPTATLTANTMPPIPSLSSPPPFSPTSMPTSAPAPSISPQIITNGLAVQASSHNDWAQAENEAIRLRSLGLDARILQVDVPQIGVRYRVQIGCYQTRSDAERNGIGLKTKGVLQDFIIVRCMKPNN